MGSSNSTTSVTDGKFATITTLANGQLELITLSTLSTSTRTSIGSYESDPADSTSTSTNSSVTDLTVVTPSYSNLESSLFESTFDPNTNLLLNNSTTVLWTNSDYHGSQTVKTYENINSTLLTASRSQSDSTYYSYGTSTITSMAILPSSTATVQPKATVTVTVQPETTVTTGSTTTTSTTTSSSTSYSSSTYVYDQLFYITDSTTSFTTDITITRTLQDNLEFTPATDEPITTDITFFNAYYSDITHVSSTGTVGNDKRNTIIGSVVGSVVGLGIVLFLLWFVLFRKRKVRQNVDEMGFSHSIASTIINQYNSTDEDDQDNLYFGSGMERRPPMRTVHSANSVGSDEHGLNSLRNSILQDQSMGDSREFNRQYYNNQIQEQHYNQTNIEKTLLGELDSSSGIETIMEETESEPSLLSPQIQSHSNQHYSRAINSSRYKNAGLPLNNVNLTSAPIDNLQVATSSPFDDPVSSRRNVPTPPPSRKQSQYRGQNSTRDENRRSVDSSIISDETDLSTDDSLLQPDGTLGDRTNGELRGAFFREIV